MNKIYQVYQVSDSTGETLDRIFLAIKAQFSNFKCKTIHFSLTRTENQKNKIISKCKSKQNVIILYTIVDSGLAKHLASECKKNNITFFEVLGTLISDFSKLLEQKASRKPSGQHVLDEEYYKRIEAIQFTITHDDGKIISDLEKSNIILVGVSRTSKTPTSIYLANRGYKTANIPIISNKKQSIKKYFYNDVFFKKIIKKKKKDKRLKYEYLKIIKYKKMIKFVYQNIPRGTGDALLKCQKFIKSKHFLMLLPDDLIMKKNCSLEMFKIHKKYHSSVIASKKVKTKDVSR